MNERSCLFLRVVKGSKREELHSKKEKKRKKKEKSKEREKRKQENKFTNKPRKLDSGCTVSFNHPRSCKPESVRHDCRVSPGALLFSDNDRPFWLTFHSERGIGRKPLNFDSLVGNSLVTVWTVQLHHVPVDADMDWECWGVLWSFSPRSSLQFCHSNGLPGLTPRDGFGGVKLLVCRAHQIRKFHLFTPVCPQTWVNNLPFHSFDRFKSYTWLTI